MKISLNYHAMLYPSLKDYKPTKAIDARDTTLEIIKVEKISEVEVWLKVKLITPSGFRYYDLPPVEKGEMGWLKVTSNPEESLSLK